MAKKILLVEDEQLLRESLAQLLTEEGYQVVQAGNGQAEDEAALVAAHRVCRGAHAAARAAAAMSSTSMLIFTSSPTTTPPSPAPPPGA